MKQAWCLAASSTSATSKALMRLYGKRWGIECGLRDTKDSRFGMGLGSIHVSTPERRDRLWLLNAFAIALLTLLGAAGEALGYDRYLKSNTTKRRTHSLFRQGCMLYELIPTMPEVRLLPLIERFTTMLARTPGLCRCFRGHLKMRGVVRRTTSFAAGQKRKEAMPAHLALPLAPQKRKVAGFCCERERTRHLRPAIGHSQKEVTGTRHRHSALSQARQ